MDESHRLKPMTANLDARVFETIFHETEPLRKKLAFNIDARKFGVDYKEILSCFNVKFIWAYNQYLSKHDTTNIGDLKGYIIRALETYQYRLMRSSYQAKFKDHHTMLNIDDPAFQESTVITTTAYEPPIENDPEDLYSKALDYLKNNLSGDAFFILELELNPPDYILREAKEMGKNIKKGLPCSLIAEYLGWDDDPQVIDYLKKLKQEIKAGLEEAKEYFSNSELKR
jgi:hypothetical protein